MSPVDAVQPRVGVHDFRRRPDGDVYDALLTVEPAVGDPYTVRVAIFPVARRIDIHRWQDLTEAQQTHWRGWAGTIVSRLLDANGVQCGPPEPPKPAA